MGSLFPCLPDDVGLLCLLKVELKSHHTLRCVCKSWNALFKDSDLYYKERKRLKFSEQRICLLEYIDSSYKRVGIYDLLKDSYKSLPPIPADQIINIVECHFVKQKVAVFIDLLDGSPRTHLWLYDFVCSKWKEGAKMPREVREFASAADEDGGMIYVAGGFATLKIVSEHCTIYSNRVSSAFVYNVEEDNWDVLPDMDGTEMYWFQGFFAGGMFYVMESSDSFQVFDSYTRSWKTVEDRFQNCRRLFLSAFGRLHCFSDGQLTEYDHRKDKVNVVVTFPMENRRQSVKCAIMINNKIFVKDRNRIDKRVDFYTLTLPSERGGTVEKGDFHRPPRFPISAVPVATLDL